MKNKVSKIHETRVKFSLFEIAGAVEDTRRTCCTEFSVVETDDPIGHGSFPKLASYVDVPVPLWNSRK